MADFLENQVYDAIQIGQIAELQRVLTRDDIALFSKVSGDLNPTHMDEEYARARGAKGLVGHSLWATGLISSLLANVLPGPGTVYRSQDSRFHRQVELGDSLRARVKVLEKQPEHVVLFECQVVNQHGETVMDGRASVIAPTEALRIEVADVADISVRHHDSFAALFERVAPLAPIVEHRYRCRRCIVEHILACLDAYARRGVSVGKTNDTADIKPNDIECGDHCVDSHRHRRISREVATHQARRRKRHLVARLVAECA
jgi:acyl dehydratase